MPSAKPTNPCRESLSAAQLVSGTEVPLENLLVVSDLHLSEGRITEKREYEPREDFRFDRDFRAFLHFYTSSPQWRDRRWKLIINGDFIDFLQVTDVAGAPADLKGLLDPYGLNCGVRETIWKLQRVYRGHQVFFSALAEFAARWPVIIVKGNHDVEFTFPQVQQEFQRILSDVLAKQEANSSAGEMQEQRASLLDTIRQNVKFCEWFYYEPGCIYLEHGHQYEADNSFRFFLDPRLPAGYRQQGSNDEIELPLGSLFVRYLFNRIETDEPYSDNIKPAQLFIKWYVRHHLRQCFGFVLREGRLFISHLQRMTQLVRHRHFMQREKSQEIRRRALAAELSMNPEDLLWIEQLQEQPTLYRPGRTWNFLLKTFRYQLAYPLLALLLFCTSSLIVGLAAPTAAFLGVFLLSTLLPELSYWIPPDWIWWLALFDAAVLVPSTLGLGYALKQIEGPDLMIDKLRTISGLIATRLQVPLITMGHTHTAEFQKLENGSVAYANTGTWTNVFLFPADKQPEHQMYYLRVLRDRDKAKPDALVHQHAELLCWKSDTVSDHTVDEGIVL